MIVVSDTSPLIALAAVGRLSLLRELHDEVLIPEAVYEEIVSAGGDLPGAREVADAEWIVKKPVSDRRFVTLLAEELDAGESEAIALAVERRADLLLVDERRARRTASRLGLKVVGVLGVLIEAKGEGLIPEVGPILDALVERAGFHVSPAIRDQVLRIVGEQPRI